MPTNDNSLQIEDLVPGRGKAAEPGDELRVHYTGWLKNGKQFDSSIDRGQPFEFTLGGKEVITGWDEGLVGLRVGGIRRLVIPARLGYGEGGIGGIIPPQSDLVFEVELLAIL